MIFHRVAGATATFLAGVFAVACGSGHPLVDTLSDGPTDAGKWDASGDDASAADGASPADDAGSDAASPSCTPGASVTYVVDTDDVLRSLDPALMPSSSAFRAIGRVSCVTAGGAAWAGAASMAVDRHGVAWVTDRNGILFQVSTLDATCKATSFQSQHGFTKIGIGFARDDAAGTETLYAVDNSNAAITGGGHGLATIDLGSLALTPIANFDGTFAGRGADLTSSGDGRIFGYFPGHPSSIAEIVPATAHIASSSPLTLSLPSSGAGEFNFSVSFWNGVFLLYTAWTADAPFTDVNKFDPATGATSLVYAQIGFRVNGAASSVCPATP
jgi:hypothetical protein